jgi:hypothetical protein
MPCTLFLLTFNVGIENFKFGGGDKRCICIIGVCMLGAYLHVSYEHVSLEHFVFFYVCHIGHSVYCDIYVHIVAFPWHAFFMIP